MYNNVGAKIKGMALVLSWLGIIFSVIGGLVFIVNGLNNRHVPYLLAGIITIALGILFSWLANIFLYSYGQLVDNTDKIRENLELQNIILQRIASSSGNGDSSHSTGSTLNSTHSISSFSSNPTESYSKLSSTVPSSSTPPASYNNAIYGENHNFSSTAGSSGNAYSSSINIAGANSNSDDATVRIDNTNTLNN